jgi:hypothetical protein
MRQRRGLGGQAAHAELGIWTKAIVFPSDPKKAVATPLALLSSEFAKNANIVDGLML